jgi:spore germination protein YaaH
MRGERRAPALVTALVLALALVASVSGGVRSSSAAPRAEAPLTAAQRRARARTTAWVPTWDSERMRTSLRANQRRIGRISPYWFRLATNGSSVEDRDAGAMDPEVLEIAARRSITVVPTITNEYDAARTTTMLRSAASRRRHVTRLVALATRPQFAGIDIDYEQVAVADRARFTAFITSLAAALHARHRTLAVSVPPATGATANAAGFRAIDDAAIGRVADEVRVLAYDDSSACGGSGPIAPIDWVEQVVRYVTHAVPARKVVLGVPMYGYDWPPTGCAQSRTWVDVEALRTAHAGTVAWSRPWKSPTMHYVHGGRHRVVWFEDSRSADVKVQLAMRHHLRGVALWRIGGEDPRTWRVLEQRLGAAR